VPVVATDDRSAAGCGDDDAGGAHKLGPADFFRDLQQGFESAARRCFLVPLGILSVSRFAFKQQFHFCFCICANPLSWDESPINLDNEQLQT
jgi:hypothetical protein